MSQYGKFFDFCRDSGSKFSTIPVCNLFNESPARSGSSAAGFGGCDLTGIGLSNGRELANLGSILLDGIAILVTIALLFFSNRKRAAVGRREMQYFLFGYLVISICEIFTIGGFPLNGAVRRAFTAVHIAAVVATAWVLLLNAIVGFQIMEDGTFVSMALVIGSSLAFVIGVGYIALDTAFKWTGYWDSTLSPPNRAYALYTLYLLAPLVFIAFYFILEAYLVVVILGERRPLLYLITAGLLFAIGQIFQFVISVHICNGTHGKINGGMFESLFTLLAVVMVWVFWSSITEDDWPTAGTPGYS
ncbi:uncharacterized protein PV09_08471 [Verruconis gallopava]|uniref:Uncharacterized protein n=1 Tax=Verruconis gallopava TaxID=253628 RepID=A0A0D2ALK1_9PEZI|nr:uncharacterized protein PV09_08471 [Verruconis gallopava]KIV99958.1 hypothetical protein PV09_08471 [Verruconis gallopava]